MSPFTHGMLSWLAVQPVGLTRGERRWLTLAGLAPDVDGVGLVVDLVTAHTATPTRWFAYYHHVVTHGLGAAVLMALVAWNWSGRRWRTFGLALGTFHLHLACDLVGSGAPDGSLWQLAYGWPFTDVSWSWSGQWALNGWQNLLISVVAMIAIMWLGIIRGRTVIEVVSLRADAGVVGVLRRWAGRVTFPTPRRDVDSNKP